MKIFSVLFVFTAHILITKCKVIPDYLPQPCSRSDVNYTDCTLNALNKLGPYLLKGIPEINFPKMNPLRIPLFVANKSFGDCANFSVSMRNAEIWGINTTYIRNFTADPKELRGAVDLHIAAVRVVAEYEIISRISTYTVKNIGCWEGNITGIDVSYKFSLNLVERDGINYYAIDDLDRERKIKGGHVKLTSKNPDYQFAADIITNFFNEDPQRAVQISNLLFKKNVLSFYTGMIDQVLSKIPAGELIPE